MIAFPRFSRSVRVRLLLIARAAWLVAFLLPRPDTAAHARAWSNSHRPHGALYAGESCGEGCSRRGRARCLAMDCITCCRAGHALVADHPGRHPRGDAVARRLLPGLPHKPRHRYPYRRPPPACVSGKPRAWPAVFVVSGLGSDTRNNWLARLSACGQPAWIDRIGAMRGCFSQRYAWREIHDLYNLTGAARDCRPTTT